MTGPEHYREAERLLEQWRGEDERDLIPLDFAEAQVHATLALAAAMALRSEGAQT